MLVTGADGFTGVHFVKQAREAGYDVFEFNADLTNPQAVQAQVDAAVPDVVVHLAAISFVGHDKPSAFYDVNVIGTLNLLDALLKLPKPPTRVLLASSANVYGNCEHSPISESQTPAPLNHYAMSKLEDWKSVRRKAWYTSVPRVRCGKIKPGTLRAPGFKIPYIFSLLIRDSLWL